MTMYSIFLSHTWSSSDATEKLSSLLLAYKLTNKDFDYEFYSVSKDDPVQHLPSKKALGIAIEEKIKLSSCLIILGGVYDQYSRWINLELDIAKQLKKPVILVEAVNSKHTHAKEKRAASHIATWNGESLGNAIMQACSNKTNR